MTHAALWEALANALEKQHGGEAEVAAAAAAPAHALSPWALWMLMGVARHLRRQERLGEVVRRELGVDLAEVARSGRVVLPDHVAPKGRLIAHQGTYRFNERGLHFRHEGSHDTVDVDLIDGGLDHVDLHRFAQGLQGNPARRDADARLFELHPSFETFEPAWDELVELGLLAVRPGVAGVARLAPEAEPHQDTLIRVGYVFGIAHDHPYPQARLVMAATLGDWIEANHLALVHRDHARWARVFTRPRAAAQAARRRERLLSRKASDREGTILLALAELDADDAAPHLREALAGPPDPRCATALRAIRYRNIDSDRPDPDYGPDVLALFRRLDLHGIGFEHLIWPRCARFLLERDLHADEVRASLSSLGDSLTPHASLLAFEFEERLAIPLLRRALHSGRPNVRADAVAILLLLDEPWCAPTLADALDTSPDPLHALEWRAGLSILKDPAGAARAWEATHPLTEEDHACRVRAETWLRARIRDLRRDVTPISNRRARNRERSRA